MSAGAGLGLAATVLHKLHRLRAVLAEQSASFKRDVFAQEHELEFLELVRTELATARLAIQRRIAGQQTHSARKPSVRFAAQLDNYRASRLDIASKATDSPVFQSRRQSAATGIIKLNGLKYFPTPVDAAEHSSSMKSKGSRRSLSSGHTRQKPIEPFTEEDADRIDLSKYKKTPDSTSFSLRIKKRLSLRDGNLVKFATDSLRRRRPTESHYNNVENSGEEPSRLVMTERNHRTSIDETPRSATKVYNIVHQPDKTVQVLNLNSPRFINKRFVITSEAAEAHADRTQDFFDSKLVLQEPKPKQKKSEYLSELLLRASANLQTKHPTSKKSPKHLPSAATPKNDSSRRTKHKSGAAVFQSPLEKLFFGKNK
jgi:hypothetical protein